MVKFTSSYNPKVIKKDHGTKPPFYLRASADFKAEQFVRVNILPYIISNRSEITPLAKRNQFLDIQQTAVIDRAPKLSLQYDIIESFLSDFVTFYRHHCSAIEVNASKKITITLLNDFLYNRRADNRKYLPCIFSTKGSTFDRKNDLVTYGASEILVEYLNIIYFEEYQNLYTIEFSHNYGYYIVANSNLRPKQSKSKTIKPHQPLPGLTARISRPKDCEDKRSMILVQGTRFELHGPGSLVIAGCIKHVGCEFPSFLSNRVHGECAGSKKTTYANSSIFFNFRFIDKKGILKDEKVRCFYGKGYFQDGDNPICVGKACDINGTTNQEIN